MSGYSKSFEDFEREIQQQELDRADAERIKRLQHRAERYSKKAIAKRRIVFFGKIAVFTAILTFFIVAFFFFVSDTTMRESNAASINTDVMSNMDYPVIIIRDPAYENHYLGNANVYNEIIDVPPVEEPVVMAESFRAGEYWVAPEDRVAKLAILPAPDGVETHFKTFMDYRTITSKVSMQYQLQEIAETNEYGMRTIDGYPLVAVGTYYADKVGYKIEVYLDTGVSFIAIVGDIKADKHTDESNRITSTGNVVEFIVDRKLIPEMCEKMGDMSYADERLEGNVTDIGIIATPEEMGF